MTTHTAVLPDEEAAIPWRDWQARGVGVVCAIAPLLRQRGDSVAPQLAPRLS